MSEVELINEVPSNFKPCSVVKKPKIKIKLVRLIMEGEDYRLLEDVTKPGCRPFFVVRRVGDDGAHYSWLSDGKNFWSMSDDYYLEHSCELYKSEIKEMKKAIKRFARGK